MISAILTTLAQVLYWLVMVRIVISFMPEFSQYPWARWVANVTEPLLQPIRRALPPVRVGAGYVDFSPMVLLLVVNLILNALRRLL
ncbi:MAG: YggT family protein [Bacillota bacterium]